MNKLNLFLIITVFLFSCSIDKQEKLTQESTKDVAYDSLLVEKYNADKYGMKQYVIAFLKRGPNRSQDSLEASQLQKAHLENIGRLAEEGILLLAGPFLDDGELRGIYIFNVKTIEEAKKLTETDPAIQKGSLVMELHPWYGSAAVMAIPEIHKKLGKINITE
ncbi:MAG: hypothetical protein GQ564_14420 [Bacteroidales bacterium]|nr:hypothetical protein [Bacteroidales bacterium]